MTTTKLPNCHFCGQPGFAGYRFVGTEAKPACKDCID